METARPLAAQGGRRTPCELLETSDRSHREGPWSWGEYASDHATGCFLSAPGPIATPSPSSCGQLVEVDPLTLALAVATLALPSHEQRSCPGRALLER